MMLLSSTVVRMFWLLSLFPLHYTVADDFEAQEDTLASPAAIAFPDDDALGETYDVNQFKESSYKAENTSDNEPGLLQQFRIDDDSESLLYADSANVNCDHDNESSSYQPLTPRRRRLTKRQSKEFCPLEPNVPTSTEQKNGEEDNGSSPSSPNYPKIPDIIIPGTTDLERTRTTRKVNSSRDQRALMVLYLYPGIDGKSNTAVCNRHRDIQVPICAPFLAARLSPAEIVKPCRFCEFLYPSFLCLGRI